MGLQSEDGVNWPYIPNYSNDISPSGRLATLGTCPKVLMPSSA